MPNSMIYWLLLYQSSNSHPGDDPPLAGLPYLPRLSPLKQFLMPVSHAAFNPDFNIHPKTIRYRAKSMYEIELSKSAIFIGQKQSNISKFTWFSLNTLETPV